MMRNAWRAIKENLDEKEKKEYEQFCKKHMNHGVHTSGCGVSAEVSADSIGGYVIVMKCSCGKEKDITNIDNW